MNEETPTLKHADFFNSGKYRRGYLKCRLVHMQGKSFVLPDILMAGGIRKGRFFSPQFFYHNFIGFFGGDGSGDVCPLFIELMGQVRIGVVFFQRDLVKQCVDNSFIYKCAFGSIDGKPIPVPQGNWRRCGHQFELALYHHTNKAGEDGIRSSGYIWSSSRNIQGADKLKNIGYGYFTSIPRIKNALQLFEIAMTDYGTNLHLLPTNAPMDIQFAQQIQVPKQTVADRNRPLKFWVDTETISPSHLWFHQPIGDFSHYEIVLPKVFRVGVEPGDTLPFKGNVLTLKPEDCKNFDYVIVGDADTYEGLSAPYHEEETRHLAKVDVIPTGTEIIARWHEKRNSPLYPSMEVELAEFHKEDTDPKSKKNP